mmetsp:Transcript_54295/g.172412  ORF Transcript_54295/g.172412 Transcript_54295/m.172412 type:complete len:268 (-) Transcript_54295:1086-1889(-)
MPTPLHTSPSATWILLTSEVQRPPGVCVSTRSRRTSIPAIGCGDCSTHITPSSGFFTPHTRLTVFTPAKVAGNSCYAKAYGSEECGEGAHFLQQGIWFQHKRSRAVVARRLIKANHTPERRAGGPHNKLGGRGKASQERRAGYLHPDPVLYAQMLPVVRLVKGRPSRQWPQRERERQGLDARDPAGWHHFHVHCQQDHPPRGSSNHAALLQVGGERPSTCDPHPAVFQRPRCPAIYDHHALHHLSHPVHVGQEPHFQAHHQPPIPPF